MQKSDQFSQNEDNNQQTEEVSINIEKTETQSSHRTHQSESNLSEKINNKSQIHEKTSIQKMLDKYQQKYVQEKLVKS